MPNHLKVISIIAIIGISFVSCLYEPFHQEKIDISNIKSIIIRKNPKPYDSTKYVPKVLNRKDGQFFVEKWNNSRKPEQYKFYPSYIIDVYFKNDTSRTFSTGGNFITENGDWSFDFNDDSLFNRLYSEGDMINEDHLELYSNHPPPPPYETVIYNAVLNLPEMKAYFHRIDSIFKDTIHGGAIINSTPTEKQPYYIVQVGESRPERFMTEYQFYVYPKKGMEVRFCDVINDTAISLSDWRGKKK